jgi:hypothetical protein
VGSRTTNVGTAKNPIWKVEIDGSKTALEPERAPPPAPNLLASDDKEPKGGFGGVDEDEQYRQQHPDASVAFLDEPDDPQEDDEDTMSDEQRDALDRQAWAEDLGMPDVTLDEIDGAAANEVPLAWTKQIIQTLRSQGSQAADALRDRMLSPEMEESMWKQFEIEDQEYRAKKGALITEGQHG